jgi:hypothetical protein
MEDLRSLAAHAMPHVRFARAGLFTQHLDVALELTRKSGQSFGVITRPLRVCRVARDR